MYLKAQDGQRAAVWGGEQSLEVQTGVTTYMCRRCCGVGWSQGGRRGRLDMGWDHRLALQDLYFWQRIPENVNPASMLFLG